VADAPRSYVEANLANIVGVEIAVTRMQGKWKMSQNRPIEDRLGVAKGLADDRDPHADAALARAVKARLP
jgi:transcriptional regulator